MAGRKVRRTDGQRDEQTDGQPLNTMPSLARSLCNICNNNNNNRNNNNNNNNNNNKNYKSALDISPLPLLCLPSIEVEIYCFASHRSFVRHISFVSVRSLCLSCRRSNTRHWPNVGLLLAHRLRRWANISPGWLACRVWRHAECGPASQTAAQH